MVAPIMIGIAGGSGSGKTTVMSKLADQISDLHPKVIPLDHYYRDLSSLSELERAEVNFDHPEAIERDLLLEQISQLRQGKTIERPTYDFSTHTRTPDTETIEPGNVIIIDGIFALADERLNQLLDLKIYIEVADDVRLGRRIKRDVEQRGRSFDGEINQYFSTVKPMHQKYIEPTRDQADLIVPWIHYNDRAVSYLSMIIRHCCGEDGSAK